GRGQELATFFAALGDKRHAPGHEYPPMHEVAERFAHECVTAIRFAERFAAINRQPGQRVEVAGRFVVEYQRRRSQRKYAASVIRRQKVRDASARIQHRVALQIALSNYLVPDRNRVPRQETVSPIVPRAAKLTSSSEQLE